MLSELHISNLAVIRDARVELAGGLNCFTGETGAGKSLVIGAIGVLLGLKPAGPLLRRGSDEGRVSGVFQVKDKQVRRELGEACDCAMEDGELLLTRRIFASGRTSASVNGQPITLAMLRRVGELLVDVHGQHDHQFLLKAANQLDVLDQYAGVDKLVDEHRGVHNELAETRRKLDELTRSDKDRRQRLDFLRFQRDEIDKVGDVTAVADEMDELEAKANKLGNIETLKTDAAAAQQALYEDDDAVLDRLRTVAKTVQELADLDPDVAEVAESLQSASALVEEAARDLGRYADRLDLDPEELEVVNERLNLINRLLKKYGPTMADLVDHHAELVREIDELDHAGENADALAGKLPPLEAKRAKVAAELTKKRRAAGKKLGPLIEKQLAELGMPKATFSVSVSAGETTSSGDDVIEFIAQTNPGLAAQPLRKIASGGELSRIMLALKQVLAAGDRISVLVFDEIDANVGGRLGSVIGGKLRQLARHHQVLCITHLPQIAAHADRHLTVRKAQGKDATVSTVDVMEGDARIEELAEMMSGEKITDNARTQARELIEVASP